MNEICRPAMDGSRRPRFFQVFLQLPSLTINSTGRWRKKSEESAAVWTSAERIFFPMGEFSQSFGGDFDEMDPRVSGLVPLLLSPAEDSNSRCRVSSYPSL